MSGLEMHGWYLESWDSIGGRAFASQRTGHSPGEICKVDLPTVFIGPPFFQVETLASAAPAFASTRGSFQAGLFLDGEEVAFESLEDIISLVKRGYQAGGMRPNPGGSTPPPRPPDSPESPEPPPAELDGGGHAIDEIMQSGFAGFSASVAELGDWPAGGVQITKSCKWAFEGETKDFPASTSNLIEASYALVVDMLERFPERKYGTEDQYLSQAIYDWMYAWQCLAETLVLLGTYHDAVSKTQDLFSSQQHSRFVAFDRRMQDHLGYGAARILDFPYRRYPYAANRLSCNIYKFLTVIPLPAGIDARYKLHKDHIPSLLTFANSIFGYSGVDLDTDQLSRSLLLFVGACIVAEGRHFYAYDSWDGERYYQKLLSDAWRWLSEQLPDRAFSPWLESLIKSVPQKWTEIQGKQLMADEALLPSAQEKLTNEQYVDLNKGVLANLLRDLTDEELERYFAGDSYTSYTYG